MDSIVAIGDVHGCASQLRALLERSEEWRQKRIVFLGDYVDVGPDSRAVIDALLEFSATKPDSVFIGGNHDAGVLRYLADGDFTTFARAGGTSTLRSYLGPTILGNVHALFADALPLAHRMFLEGLTTAFETEHLVFSHSGFDPTVAPRRASGTDELRLRPNGLVPPPAGGKIAVFGHYFQQGQLPYFGDHQICVDTGCGTLGGPLTALTLPEGEAVQAWPDGRVTRTSLRSEFAKLHC